MKHLKACFEQAEQFLPNIMRTQQHVVDLKKYLMLPKTYKNTIRMAVQNKIFPNLFLLHLSTLIQAL